MLEEAVAEYKRLVTLIGDQSREACRDELVQLLTTRDWITQKMSSGAPVSCALIKEIEAADSNLRRQAATSASLRLGFNRTYRLLESSRQEWWWKLHEVVPDPTRRDKVFQILSTVCFTIAATISVDIVRRFLVGAPDGFALAGVSGQIILTLLAGSAFTSSGKRALASAFANLRLPRDQEPTFAMLCSVIFLALCMVGSESLPRISNYLVNSVSSIPVDVDVSPALTRLRLAVALNPNSAKAHFALSSLYERASAPEQALANLEATLTIQPTHIPALLDISRFYMAEGRPEYDKAALYMFRLKKLNEDPSCPRDLVEELRQPKTHAIYLKDLGWLYYGDQKYFAAYKYLSMAVKIDKTSIVKPEDRLQEPYALLAKLAQDTGGTIKAPSLLGVTFAYGKQMPTTGDGSAELLWSVDERVEDVRAWIEMGKPKSLQMSANQ